MKVKGLTHGIYEVYWASGGSSIGSVGYDQQGYNWFAPCNWTSGSTVEWSGIKAIKLLIQNDYSVKTKAIKGVRPKQPFTSDYFNIILEDEDV